MIPPPISLPGARQYGALLLNDGKTIYFSSDREGGYGDLDNYYSERKGDQWGEPVNFGPQINTPDQDADMAVSKDGNVIIFPSKRSDSINGSTDLYITRKVNNGWSPPENLGPRINTPETDTCPWLTYDGQTLYLHSEWDGLLFGKKGPMSTWAFRYPKGFH